MPFKIALRLAGYSIASALVFSTLGSATASAEFSQLSSANPSTLASVTATAIIGPKKLSLAQPLRLDPPALAWSVGDFHLASSEQQLVIELARYQSAYESERPAPDCAVLRCVALTFDDGPSRHTQALLEVLAKYRAPATFFVVGSAVRAMPQALLEIQAAGHEIALHSDRHQRMTSLGSAAIVRDFERSRKTLRELAGIESELYRPPFGVHSSRVGRLANAAIIMWDVDPQDWRVRNSSQITQRVLSQVNPGSIVVLHELEQTAAALEGMVAELQNRGYTLVTVSEILGEVPIHSKIYRSGLAPADQLATG